MTFFRSGPAQWWTPARRGEAIGGARQHAHGRIARAPRRGGSARDPSRASSSLYTYCVYASSDGPAAHWAGAGKRIARQKARRRASAARARR